MLPNWPFWKVKFWFWLLGTFSLHSWVATTGVSKKTQVSPNLSIKWEIMSYLLALRLLAGKKCSFSPQFIINLTPMLSSSLMSQEVTAVSRGRQYRVKFRWYLQIPLGSLFSLSYIPIKKKQPKIMSSLRNKMFAAPKLNWGPQEPEFRPKS